MSSTVDLLIITIALAIFAIIFEYLYLWFHEGGHYLAAKLSGFKNVKIGYTKYKFPTHVEIDDGEIARTPNVDMKILFATISGPVLGFIPFIAMYLLIRPIRDALTDISVGILMLTYLYGCRKDFKLIIDSTRGMISNDP